MIFVTVGTHEQQFDRLIRFIDEMKRNNEIKEEVIMQIGYCTYIPHYCEYAKFYPYKEMINLVEKARIVITHGGPSSFIMPLQVGKAPIVVPRQQQYNEHVNNHQLHFVNEVANRYKNLLVVNEIERLRDLIINYEAYALSLTNEVKNNNTKFVESFDKIVSEMFKNRNL